MPVADRSRWRWCWDSRSPAGCALFSICCSVIPASQISALPPSLLSCFSLSPSLPPSRFTPFQPSHFHSLLQPGATSVALTQVNAQAHIDVVACPCSCLSHDKPVMLPSWVCFLQASLSNDEDDLRAAVLAAKDPGAASAAPGLKVPVPPIIEQRPTALTGSNESERVIQVITLGPGCMPGLLSSSK